jgi:protein SCO1/2
MVALLTARLALLVAGVSRRLAANNRNSMMRRFRIAAVALGLCLLALAPACGGTASTLSGTALDQQPAPDFTLTDQRGESVTLSSLHGNAIALTFIYTHCTDVCPLIAQKLHDAYTALPASDQQRVRLLAVTVDPARDSTAALAQFSEKHSLANNPNWHAMTGDNTTLATIWKAYFIDVSGMIEEDASPVPGAAATTEPGPPTNSSAHTDAIYIIDKEGNERVLMHSSATPQEIADNLKALAN